MDAITEITDKSNNWADTASHSLELQYTNCFILKPDPKISKSLQKVGDCLHEFVPKTEN
jgi:hypothetical protein